jgi:dCMP deaminase
MRLSWHEYGCMMALAASSRSEDPHTKVGACILNKEGRVISTGYNGLKKGFAVKEWMKKEENRPKKREIMIHAETNALSLIRKGEAESICLTISPCFACAKDIVAHEIQRVFYIREYDQCNKFKEVFDFYKVHYQELKEENISKIKSHLQTWL